MIGFADFMAACTNPKGPSGNRGFGGGRFRLWVGETAAHGVSSWLQYAGLSCIGQSAVANWKVTG
jgi:hypothetical protein